MYSLHAGGYRATVKRRITSPGRYRVYSDRLDAECRRVQLRNKYLLPRGENPLAGVAPAGRRGTAAEIQKTRIAPGLY